MGGEGDSLAPAVAQGTAAMRTLRAKPTRALVLFLIRGNYGSKSAQMRSADTGAPVRRNGGAGRQVERPAKRADPLRLQITSTVENDHELGNADDRQGEPFPRISCHPSSVASVMDSLSVASVVRPRDPPLKCHAIGSSETGGHVARPTGYGKPDNDEAARGRPRSTIDRRCDKGLRRLGPPSGRPSPLLVPSHPEASQYDEPETRNSTTASRVPPGLQR